MFKFRHDFSYLKGMRITTFFSALLMLGAIVISPANTWAQRRGSIKSVSSENTVQEINRLVNQHRASKGMKPLLMNSAITKEAEKHSRNMASGKVAFGHDGFDGRANRLMSAIKNGNSAGENVEYTEGNAAHVVENWLNSPVHKKNIEGDFNLTGIGMARGANGQVYYTQIFIKN